MRFYGDLIRESVNCFLNNPMNPQFKPPKMSMERIIHFIFNSIFTTLLILYIITTLLHFIIYHNHIYQVLDVLEECYPFETCSFSEKPLVDIPTQIEFRTCATISDVARTCYTRALWNGAFLLAGKIIPLGQTSLVRERVSEFVV